MISEDTEIEERLVEAMGYDTVILTAEERGIIKGKKQGIEQGVLQTTIELIKNAMEIFALSFDEACVALKIKDK